MFKKGNRSVWRAVLGAAVVCGAPWLARAGGPGDHKPKARAGADQTVLARRLVRLDGSASSDPDHDPLTFAWRQTAGPAVVLSDPASATPTFVAPDIAAPHQKLTFMLRVSDPRGKTNGDTTNVTVRRAAPNTPPQANAGPDITAMPGAVVTLNGSASSDPTNDALSYAWTQTGGSAVALSAPAAPVTQFTAPAAAGLLAFDLAVRDAGGLTSHDGVVVALGSPNHPPKANAGPDQTANAGAAVKLDGTGSSDPDGDPITFAWSQSAGPAVAFDNAASATPSFTAPSVTADTTLTFHLLVTDSHGATGQAVTHVLVHANKPPVANAGPDATAPENTRVTLNGSASSDPNGDPLTFAWAQIDGPPVALDNAASATPSFMAPDVALDTVLTFRLTVKDPGGLSSDAVVRVTDQNIAPPGAPVADPGPDRSVFSQSVVRLSGVASHDPEGGTLRFQWREESGPPIQLSDPADVNPSFDAPAVTTPTVISLILTVTDPTNLSGSARLLITVVPRSDVNLPPVANAGADREVRPGVTVTLDGSGSTDPNNDPLTYKWVQKSGPAVSLTGATGPQATFTSPGSDAVLVFALTVADPKGLTATDDVTVRVVPTAGNEPPVVSLPPFIDAFENTEVRLDASGAVDPEGGPLQFHWVQTGGPPVVLQGADGAVAVFVAPSVDAPVTLTFSLAVSDGLTTTTATTAVRVANVPPAFSGIGEFSIFPNPCDPNRGGATIRYTLGEASSAEIRIYDAFGHLVRTFNAAAGSAGGVPGVNDVAWDARNGDGQIVGNGGYDVYLRVVDSGGTAHRARRRVAVVR